MRTALKLHLLLPQHKDLIIKLEVDPRDPGQDLVKLLSKEKKIKCINNTTLRMGQIILLQKKQSNMKCIWILQPVLSEVFPKILSFSLKNQTLQQNKSKIIQPRFLRY
jgi:hypothetical protein